MLRMIVGVVMWGLVGLPVVTLAAPQGTPAAVERIRAHYADVGQRIERSRQEGDERLGAGIFTIETVVNRSDQPWPAVGIYQVTTRFHFDYGSREENPYPDRLQKVEVDERVSARSTYSEYLFDERGDLVFVFTREGDAGESPSRERRLYLDRGRVVRYVEGERTTDDPPAARVAGIRDRAMAEGRRLRDLFEKALAAPADYGER